MSFWLEKEDGLREVDQWGRFGCFLVTFWLEKRDSKGWSGSPELASGCEVVYKKFPSKWACFRWVWSPAGKWVMVAVETEKMELFRGGCLVAGQQRGDERLVGKMEKQRLKLLSLQTLPLGLSVRRVGHGFKNG
ncbi:hypothetical protein KY290_023359 [Solanum tuberosum]|uniref:Uncharacterized protein n=1 Tax=Solanum tuberosum TaxID=4113 RepID=A0ABQ7V740_SOLTU|nr:hypothetical protein KY289_020495 [Solanum tuberosum]KAH0693160.1 hypothetical protein KY285_020257 [Solanum tuberosum]KAH0759866.1 hypothetical protein KY290_023359 [Solanum tuberosum]